MIHRFATAAFALGLCALSPGSAVGQAPSAPSHASRFGSLGQNQPNPFGGETYIPFTIDDCAGAQGQRHVSLRIYNVLAQLVATPVLHGTDRPIAGVRLSCGEYTGYWDGRLGKSRRPAPAGVYVYELVVDGERSSKKMFLSR